ncbi:hypothetical protein K7X08_006479 [Anisodus acutangulus]|uniref:DUF1338 domain-containing protein n=1 Tax=Anisodus acutangulus TaxID=402998 RepID=A0A9Q1MVV6_9SOLA|nr:hypothetical protein K7X08_006479 [Anisodus acutangulus]
MLLGESEYAAWALVNGYALNHVTISTHRLTSKLRSIGNLNQFIEGNGFNLNSEDSTSFEFSDGITEAVPCSYIERHILQQYKDLPSEEVEVGNADKIFESVGN